MRLVEYIPTFYARGGGIFFTRHHVSFPKLMTDVYSVPKTFLAISSCIYSVVPRPMERSIHVMLMYLCLCRNVYR